jgi:hypothetical protein
MEHLLPLAILLAVCIAFPIGLAWRIAKLDEASRGAWALKAADSLLFFGLILLVGRWDIAGLWTRAVLVVLVLLAFAASWWRHARRPWALARPLWRAHGVTLVSLVFYATAFGYLAVGLAPAGSPTSLAFPLEGGRFMVAQGGNRTLLNHHHAHRRQRHASDIVAVGPAGFRAIGAAPADLSRYAVHGAKVVSPCTGTVASVRDGLPDLAPPRRDKANASGNHIVIHCDALQVELAHLRQGSVVHKAGDAVAAGQRVGAVGNSGNTTEPHLHIHAVDAVTGEAAEIAFDDEVPVRNRIFER